MGVSCPPKKLETDSVCDLFLEFFLFVVLFVLPLHVYEVMHKHKFFTQVFNLNSSRPAEIFIH